MVRRLPQSPSGAPPLLAAVTLAAVTLAGGASAAVAPAKVVAERRILAVLGRKWSPARLRGFVDPRTRLPFDNVQAACRPRRGQKGRPTRFICVVRPRDRTSAVRLYLSYSSLGSAGFRVHWLDLRGR